MQSLEQLKVRLETAVPGAHVEIIANGSAANQPSLLIDRDHGWAIAKYLRDAPELRFDYTSNVTGVDWPENASKEKRPACLEAVYHLYSVALKEGPLVIRLRTENRTDKVTLPSLTPIWRSCDFQEREIFDLYGIIFEGHPDLRRILMWDGYVDHPMRKDFVAPNDYEYEPTPHDDVLERARELYPKEPAV
jgi:NADH-quinone oxidoreductase subunit C